MSLDYLFINKAKKEVFVTKYLGNDFADNEFLLCYLARRVGSCIEISNFEDKQFNLPDQWIIIYPHNFKSIDELNIFLNEHK